MFALAAVMVEPIVYLQAVIMLLSCLECRILEILSQTLSPLTLLVILREYFADGLLVIGTLEVLLVRFLNFQSIELLVREVESQPDGGEVTPTQFL